MTSQGHAYAQFQRALKTGNAFLALEAARELTHVPLEDALGLCLLLRIDGRRYQRASARWLARYYAEVDGVTLSEIQDVADLLAAIPVHGADPAGALALRFDERGRSRCAQRIREMTASWSSDAA
jgi:hypothetical protein